MSVKRNVVGEDNFDNLMIHLEDQSVLEKLQVLLLERSNSVRMLLVFLVQNYSAGAILKISDFAGRAIAPHSSSSSSSPPLLRPLDPF